MNKGSERRTVNDQGYNEVLIDVLWYHQSC